MNYEQKGYLALVFTIAASVSILELCGLKLSNFELVIQLVLLVSAAAKFLKSLTK
jgi:hypothetical protein